MFVLACTLQFFLFCFVSFVECRQRYTIAWEKEGDRGKKRKHGKAEAGEEEGDAGKSKKTRRGKDNAGAKE